MYKCLFKIAIAFYYNNIITCMSIIMAKMFINYVREVRSLWTEFWEG